MKISRSYQTQAAHADESFLLPKIEQVAVALLKKVTVTFFIRQSGDERWITPSVLIRRANQQGVFL